MVDPEGPRAGSEESEDDEREPEASQDGDPGPEDVGVPEKDARDDERPGRARKVMKAAAGAAADAAWAHRHELMAALELLREKKAVTQDEQKEIVEAYEGGDPKTQDIIADLVERLEEANLGKVAIEIRDRARSELSRSLGPFLGVEPGQEIRREDLMRTGKHLVGEVGDEVRDQGGVIVQDLVRQGRHALVQDETQEMERIFIRWAAETLTMFERFVSRSLIGVGVVLILVAVLWSAHQVEFLRDVVRFGSVFLLVFVGILMISWSSKVAEWAHTSRQELDEYIESGPSDRLDKALGRREERRASAGKGPGPSPPEPPTDK